MRPDLPWYQRLDEGAGIVHWGASPAAIARRASGPAWLASPITLRFGGEGEADWFVLERLLREAALDLDALALAGVSAISPAVQALEMIRARGLGWERSIRGARGVLDRDYWMRWCQPLFRACTLVVVSDRPGWQASQGIALEVSHALERNVPVFFMAGRESVPLQVERERA